jgi:hypothetical protein
MGQKRSAVQDDFYIFPPGNYRLRRANGRLHPNSAERRVSSGRRLEGASLFHGTAKHAASNSPFSAAAFTEHLL